jgi:hypothetical protein
MTGRRREVNVIRGAALVLAQVRQMTHLASHVFPQPTRGNALRCAAFPLSLPRRVAPHWIPQKLSNAHQIIQRHEIT